MSYFDKLKQVVERKDKTGYADENLPEIRATLIFAARAIATPTPSNTENFFSSILSVPL